MHPRTSSYRVKRGDTLSKIALHQYGNSAVWPAIAKANRIPNSNLILIGMKLHLPIVPGHGHAHHHPAHHTQVGSNGTPAKHLAAPPLPVQSPSVPPPSTLSAPLPSTPLGVSSAPVLPNQTATSPEVHTPEAKPVSYPNVKYTFDALPPIVLTSGGGEIKLSLKGSVTLKKKGSMTTVELFQDGHVAGSMKSEYDSGFAKLASDTKIEIDPVKRTTAVTCSYTITGRVNGQPVTSSTYAIKLPATLVYTAMPEPIKGESNGFNFEGTLGYKLEFTPSGKPPSGDPQTQRVQVEAPSHSAWGYAAAGGLVLLGVGIIVLDAAKDVGTAGVGAVETPLSWSAAMAAFRGAAALAF